MSTINFTNLVGHGRAVDHALSFLSEKDRLEAAPACKTFNTAAKRDNQYLLMKGVVKEAMLLLRSQLKDSASLYTLSRADANTYLTNISGSYESLASALTNMGDKDVALNLLKNSMHEGSYSLERSVNCGVLASLEAQNKTDEVSALMREGFYSPEEAIPTQAMARLVKSDYKGVIELLPRLEDKLQILCGLIARQAKTEKVGVAEETLRNNPISLHMTILPLCLIDAARDNFASAKVRLLSIQHPALRVMTAMALIGFLAENGSIDRAKEIVSAVPEVADQARPHIDQAKFDLLDHPSALADARAETDPFNKIRKLSIVVCNLARCSWKK